MLAPATDTFLDDLNAFVQQVKTLPRVRFETDLGPDADLWLRKKHAAGAVHEPATLAAFLAAQKHHPIKHVFDLGALFGYFTLFALQAFDDGVEVTAFEMHPGCIEPLARNVHPYTKVVNAVISDEVKPEQRFWISGFNIYEKPEGGWDKLADVPGAMKERGENNRGRGWGKLPFITLDFYCQANPLPDLIKIDVEGYQAKAVQGALGVIEKNRPVIIIELHDTEKIERFGITNKSTVQPLFDLNYRAYWCENFRDRDARFEAVDVMDERHEKLGIMVLVP